MTEALTTIWTHELRDPEAGGAEVVCVGISDDGSTIVASCGDGFFVLNAGGDVRWSGQTEETCIAVSVSPDGKLIAAGASNDQTRLYDGDGNEVWSLPVEHDSCAVYIAGAPPYVATALTEGRVVQLMPLRSVVPRWSAPLEDGLNVVTSRDGRVTVASTTDSLHIFDERGRVKRRIEVAGLFWGLAMDESGTHFAALDSRGEKLFFYETDGPLVWTQSVGERPLRLSMTAGGEVLAYACASGVRLLRRDGEEFARYQTGDDMYSVAMTPNGSLIVAGGAAGRVHLLRNRLPVGGAERPDPSLGARLLVPEIRSRYLEDPHRGLCRWFGEFDRALRAEAFELCDALLEEISRGGYDLDESEAKYVDSRRGALCLGRGLALHIKGRFDEARKYYEQSLALSQAARNVEGEGQARAILLALRHGADGDAEELLEDFRSRLRVLGSAEALLTHRLKRAPPERIPDLIQAAKEGGHLEPLLTALESPPDEQGRAAALAAAALVYLKPGADEQVLLANLEHPNWFVRWRLAEHLNRLWSAKEGGRGGVDSVAAALAREQDPEVLCELVEIIGEWGGVEHTGLLVPLLKDWDDNVKVATCRALGVVGDRSALPALWHVDGGQNFAGESVHEVKESAITAIEERYPGIAVESTLLHTAPVGADDDPKPTYLFSPTSPAIYGRVTFAGYDHLARATVHQANDGGDFDLNIYTGPGEAGRGDNPADEPELVRLIPEGYDEAGEGGSLSFELPRPAGGWLPGWHELKVSVDEGVADVVMFKIGKECYIKRCRLSSALTPDNTPVTLSHVFPKGTPDVFCHVALDSFPADMRVSVKVLDSRGMLVAEDLTWTVVEDEQEVLLTLAVGELAAGNYTAVVETEVGSPLRRDLVIIDEVRFSGARLHGQAVVAGESPGVPPVYLQDDDFALSVDVSATPPGYTIRAECFWNKRRIYDEPCAVITRRAGEQTATFVFHKPAGGWPPGEYEVVVSGEWAGPERVSFSVHSPLLLHRLRQAAAAAGAFIRRQLGGLAALPIRWASGALLAWVLISTADALLTRLTGPQSVASTYGLRLGHALRAVGPTWWILSGVALGVLAAFREKGAHVGRVYRLAALLFLTLVNITLWQQATYFVFGAGYLWPQSLGGLFSEILYAAPLLAWAGSALIVIVLVYNQQNPQATVLAFPLLLVALYLGGVAGGFILGVVIWLPFYLFGSHLAGAAWATGLKVGFVPGIIRIFLWLAQRDGRKT